MEIIPAIDLLDGNCVRLNQGDYEQVTYFNCNPRLQALSWQEKGAHRLHLVDLDGAKTGNPINDLSIKQITKSINIPIQIGGGIRSYDRAKELLDIGIDKVILGTIAIDKPELVNELANEFPGKIIVGIDAKDGKVATRGWLTEHEKLATELAKDFSNTNIAGIIATDIATDGTLEGPNIEALREIASSTKIPVIASGGIGSISDLISLMPLEQYGVIGVIVGRALYDGKIDLGEALKAMSGLKIQDSPTGKNYLV